MTATAPTQTPAEQYAANVRRTYEISKALAALSPAESYDSPLRDEMRALLAAGDAIDLPKGAKTHIDRVEFARAYPEKAAEVAELRAQGVRFTQPGRKGNPWAHRVSGRVQVRS